MREYHPDKYHQPNTVVSPIELLIVAVLVFAIRLLFKLTRVLKDYFLTEKVVSPEEQKYRSVLKEIQRLKKEKSEVFETTEFVKSAKLQRRINKLEIEAQRWAASIPQDAPESPWPSRIENLVFLCLHLVLIYLFYDTVFLAFPVLDSSSLDGMLINFSPPLVRMAMSGEVGAVVWVGICYKAANTILGK